MEKCSLLLAGAQLEIMIYRSTELFSLADGDVIYHEGQVHHPYGIDGECEAYGDEVT